MKRLLFILLAMCLWAPVLKAESYVDNLLHGPQFSVDGFRFEVIDQEKKTVVIGSNKSVETADWGMKAVAHVITDVCRTNEFKGDIVIPEKVTYEGEEYTVTDIAQGMFCGCTELKSVVMPNSITNIHPYAFYDCSGLESVKFSENVKILWPDVFIGCKSLKFLDLTHFELVYVNAQYLDKLVLPGHHMLFCSIDGADNPYCDYVYPGFLPPYPVYVEIKNVPSDCKVYYTQEDAVFCTNNLLHNAFSRRWEYKPNAANSYIKSVEAVAAGLGIDGRSITAPEACDALIYNIAGNMLAKVKAGETVLGVPAKRI